MRFLHDFLWNSCVKETLKFSWESMYTIYMSEQWPQSKCKLWNLTIVLALVLLPCSPVVGCCEFLLFGHQVCPRIRFCNIYVVSLVFSFKWITELLPLFKKKTVLALLSVDRMQPSAKKRDDTRREMQKNSLHYQGSRWTLDLEGFRSEPCTGRAGDALFNRRFSLQPT